MTDQEFHEHLAEHRRRLGELLLRHHGVAVGEIEPHSTAAHRACLFENGFTDAAIARQLVEIAEHGTDAEVDAAWHERTRENNG